MKTLNKLENCIEKLNHEDKLWIKYFKKGKVFARYGVFSTFKDGVFTLVADSLKRSGKIVHSNIPLKEEEIIFIGNTVTGEIVFIDRRYMDVSK